MAFLGIRKRKTVQPNSDTFPIIAKAAQLRLDNPADWIREPQEIPRDKCPECKTGNLIKRDGKYGEFYGCSNYPKCRFTRKC